MAGDRTYEPLGVLTLGAICLGCGPATDSGHVPVLRPDDVRRLSATQTATASAVAEPLYAEPLPVAWRAGLA